jgi:hypothetical protein
MSRRVLLFKDEKSSRNVSKIVCTYDRNEQKKPKDL